MWPQTYLEEVTVLLNHSKSKKVHIVPTRKTSIANRLSISNGKILLPLLLDMGSETFKVKMEELFWP